MTLIPTTSAIAIGILTSRGGSSIGLDLLICGVEAPVALSLNADLIKVQRLLRFASLFWNRV